MDKPRRSSVVGKLLLEAVFLLGLAYALHLDVQKTFGGWKTFWRKNPPLTFLFIALYSTFLLRAGEDWLGWRPPRVLGWAWMAMGVLAGILAWPRPGNRLAKVLFPLILLDMGAVWAFA